MALLGAPGRDGFGRHPVVVRDEAGRLIVYGAREHSGAALSSEDLADLVRRGDAVRVTHAPTVLSPDHCAGWLGSDFSASANGLRHQARPPAGPTFAEPLGTLWIAPGDEVYRHLDIWLRNAAKSIFEARGGRIALRPLARLMLHVLPDRIETRAAVWTTSPEPAKALAYLARLATARGEAPQPDALKASFEAVIEQYAGSVRRRATATGLARLRVERAPFLQAGAPC